MCHRILGVRFKNANKLFPILPQVVNHGGGLDSKLAGSRLVFSEFFSVMGNLMAPALQSRNHRLIAWAIALSSETSIGKGGSFLSKEAKRENSLIKRHP
jgi:cyanate permease